MTQRFEGRNLDEALDAAADALGVERSRLSHQTVVEKRGFLGGVKRVVIDVDVRDDADGRPPEPAESAPVTAPPPAPAAAPPSPASRAPREGGERAGGRGRGRERARGRGRQDDRRGRGERSDRSRTNDLRPGDFSRFAEDAIPDQDAQSPAEIKVRDWCEELLDLARLNVVVRTSETEERIDVRLFGRDADRFVDRAGELLDAMQVLANKAFVGRSVEKDIEFDCHDFKRRRMDDLERRARELADDVRSNGGEQLLPAMSPIERRIVHIALQDDAEVTTQSRGEGFYKRVAIVPRSAVAASEP